jgi:hypothetical protein
VRRVVGKLRGFLHSMHSDTPSRPLFGIRKASRGLSRATSVTWVDLHISYFRRGSSTAIPKKEIVVAGARAPNEE